MYKRTIESRKLKVLRFNFEISVVQVIDIKVYNPQTNYYHHFPYQTCFVCVTETSQGDVSFRHTKYMFFYRSIAIKLVHK